MDYRGRALRQPKGGGSLTFILSKVLSLLASLKPEKPGQATEKHHMAKGTFFPEERDGRPRPPGIAKERGVSKKVGVDDVGATSHPLGRRTSIKRRTHIPETYLGFHKTTAISKKSESPYLLGPGKRGSCPQGKGRDHPYYKWEEKNG